MQSSSIYVEGSINNFVSLIIRNLCSYSTVGDCFSDSNENIRILVIEYIRRSAKYKLFIAPVGYLKTNHVDEACEPKTHETKSPERTCYACTLIS